MTFEEHGSDAVVTEEDVTCVKQTAKAVLVHTVGDPTDKLWIPQSCVHEDSEVFELGGVGKLVIPRWFAEKEGWV